MNEICDLSVVVLEGKSSVILFLTMINLCVCVCVFRLQVCVCVDKDCTKIWFFMSLNKKLGSKMSTIFFE